MVVDRFALLQAARAALEVVIEDGAYARPQVFDHAQQHGHLGTLVDAEMELHIEANQPRAVGLGLGNLA